MHFSLVMRIIMKDVMMQPIYFNRNNRNFAVKNTLVKKRVKNIKSSKGGW